jgi:hypothetical protein
MRRPNRLLTALPAAALLFAAPAPVVVQAEGWQPRGDLGAP